MNAHAVIQSGNAPGGASSVTIANIYSDWIQDIITNIPGHVLQEVDNMIGWYSDAAGGDAVLQDVRSMLSMDDVLSLILVMWDSQVILTYGGQIRNSNLRRTSVSAQSLMQAVRGYVLNNPVNWANQL